jgi:hypothetical protein
MQASFLGDPALIEAHQFIERMLEVPIQTEELAVAASAVRDRKSKAA